MMTKPTAFLKTHSFSFTLIQMELCHELLNNIHRPVALLQLFIPVLNKILGASGFFCNAADPIGRLLYHGIDICYGTADLTDMFFQLFHGVFGFLHNIPESVRIHVILLPHFGKVLIIPKNGLLQIIIHRKVCRCQTLQILIQRRALCKNSGCGIGILRIISKIRRNCSIGVICKV